MADFTARDIRNIFGVMNSIDYGDVSEDVLPMLDWKRFADNPMRVFPKLEDSQQDAIAAIINKRLARNGE
jgi:hypothetical protein